MKTNPLTRILRSGLALGAAGLLTASAWAQQASLVLEGGDMVICHKNNTEWSLAKTADQTSLPTGTGTSLDGQTIDQILAVAETALGGGALPVDYTIANLNDLATKLNEAFDNGTVVTLWATLHLTR